MEESILFAKKFVEDMLSFFGLNTDVKASHEDEVIAISVPSTYLNGFLIGHNGETMHAMQYLTSSALKGAGMPYDRVNLDVADYKKQRQERLAEQVEKWAEEVRATGKTMEVKPMNAADRRVVHKTVAEYEGLQTSSEGERRDRHVVISSVSGKAAPEVDDEADEPEVAVEKPKNEKADDKKPKEEKKDAK